MIARGLQELRARSSDRFLRAAVSYARVPRAACGPAVSWQFEAVDRPQAARRRPRKQDTRVRSRVLGTLAL